MVQSNVRSSFVRNQTTENGIWWLVLWCMAAGHIDTTECWPLRSDSTWHGFKTSITSTCILTRSKSLCWLRDGKRRHHERLWYSGQHRGEILDEHGIVVEKTGPYNLLFLLASVSIRPKHWACCVLWLTSTCVRPEPACEKHAAVSVSWRPEFYENMRIQELAQNIHKLMFTTICRIWCIAHLKCCRRWYDSICCVPERAARYDRRSVPDEMVGRINANMILPYPPGVPW